MLYIPLGYAYHKGLGGLLKNRAEGFAYFLKAAEADDAAGQYRTGLAYYKGKVVDRDYTQAAEWWQKAADHGNADAQNALGIAYFKAKGVGGDSAKAISYCTKAAEQGDSNAKLSLQNIYYKQRDYLHSHMWFTIICADIGETNSIIKFLLRIRSWLQTRHMTATQIAEARALAAAWIAAH